MISVGFFSSVPGRRPPHVHGLIGQRLPFRSFEAVRLIGLQGAVHGPGNAVGKDAIVSLIAGPRDIDGQ